MATIRGAGVRVVGLDDFRKELRKLEDKGLIDELKGANFDVATQVVSWATMKANALGRMEAKAASSLKAGKAQARASVSFGGKQFSFAAGSEFGAIPGIERRTKRGVVRGWNQFKGWRGNDRSSGYWLFPSIRADEPQIIGIYGDAIEKIASKAFPD